MPGDVLDVSVATTKQVAFSDEEGEESVPGPPRLLHSPTQHLDTLRWAQSSHPSSYMAAEPFIDRRSCMTVSTLRFQFR